MDDEGPSSQGELQHIDGVYLDYSVKPAFYYLHLSSYDSLAYPQLRSDDSADAQAVVGI